MSRFVSLMDTNNNHTNIFTLLEQQPPFTSSHNIKETVDDEGWLHLGNMLRVSCELKIPLKPNLPKFPSPTPSKSIN